MMSASINLTTLADEDPSSIRFFFVKKDEEEMTAGMKVAFEVKTETVIVSFRFTRLILASGAPRSSYRPIQSNESYIAT